MPIARFLLSWFRLSFREFDSGSINLLPLFDEPIQVARVDQDPAHRSAIAPTRARNADRGHMSAEHEVAQRPVAAAKIRRCRVKVHEPAAERGRSSAHAEILTETKFTPAIT
jgi:hypothetical protein